MSRKGKKGYRGVVVQCLVAMPVLTLLLSFVCAKLIINGLIQEERIDICGYVIVAIISFLVSIYCAIRMPQKKAMWGIGASVSYAVMLLMGNLLFFGLGYGEVTSVILGVFAGGVPGSLIGALKRRKYA